MVSLDFYYGPRRLCVHHVFVKDYIKMETVFENNGYRDKENDPWLRRSRVLDLVMFDKLPVIYPWKSHLI